MLIRAQEEPAGVFYLTEGVVRQYTITADGEDLTINVFKAPSFFPLLWVMNDTGNQYYFEAMTKATIWIAPKKDFLTFLKEEPDVLFDLIKRIYKGLEGYFMKMERLMKGSSQVRLLTELLVYARRFGKQHESTILITVKLTEKDLAAQSGIARETVSRELKKLKQKGLLTFEHNILRIHDIQKLEDELLLN